MVTNEVTHLPEISMFNEVGCLGTALCAAVEVYRMMRSSTKELQPEELSGVAMLTAEEDWNKLGGFSTIIVSE